MSALSATELPRPKDWQAFERGLRVIAQSHFCDPTPQLNGRSGQAQNGVDVYGYRNGDTSKVYGLQAKKSDDPISETELEAEVEKAKKFKPNLSEYFFVTTTKRDQKLQKKARKITQSLKQSGRAMRVTVWFWDDVTEIAQLDAAIWKAFDPTYSNFAEKEGEKTRLLISEHATQHDERLGKLTTQVERLADRVDRAGGADAKAIVPADPGSTPRHGQITAWVALINDGQAHVIARYLEREIEREWQKASPTERYRLKAALAGAHIKRGNFEEASKLLKEANALKQYPEKTAVNTAKAALLDGDFKIAESLALEAAASYPENEEIYGILVQARANQGATLDPREGVPEKFSCRPEIYAGYVHWLRSRDNDEWLSVAQEALAHNPDSKYLKAIAAEAVLQSVTGNRQGYIGGAIAAKFDHRALADSAEALAAYVENSVGSNEFVEESAIHNALLALRLTENGKRALNIYELAADRFPDSEPIRLQAALLYLARDEAEKALSAIGAAPDALELKLLRLEILLASGKSKEALNEINQFSEDELPAARRRMLDSVKVRAISAAQGTQAALDYLQYALSELPDNMHLRAIEIDILASAGKREDAIGVLNNAISKAHRDTEFIDRFELAREAIGLDAYDAVVSLLENHVAFDRMSEGLRLLVVACLNGGLSARAQSILGSLSPEAASHPFIKRAEAVLAINTGDPRAEEKIDASLATRPDDIEMTIAKVERLMSISVSTASKYLERLDTGMLRGDPVQFISLAQILVRLGLETKGMALGYATLMDNWNKPSVHLRYQGLVFGAPSEAKLIPEPEEVSIDVAVEVSIDGKAPTTFLIEDDSYSTFADMRIHSNDPLTKQIVGLSASDEIDIESGDGARRYKIVSLKHKWLFALHTSIDSFEKRFPTSLGMKSFVYDKDAPDPFHELKRLTKAQADRAEYVLSVYAESGIPQCMVAKALGNDSVELWRGMASEGKSFLACIGVAPERARALKAIAENGERGAVVDAVTAAMIRQFGILEAVVGILGELRTTQSVIDVFRERVAELEIHKGREFLSVAWRNNGLERMVVDQYRVAEAIRFRQEELDWINANCKVIPALPKVDPDGQARATLEAFPTDAVHVASGAQGSGLLLLSEDMAFRQWSETAFGVSSTWLQPVLLQALRNDLIAPRQFAEAMCAMVRFGHRYVSLNSVALIEISERDDFSVSADLQAMLDMIGGPNADLSSNIPVVALLIDRVVGARGNRLETLALSSAVFRAMARGRMKAKRPIVEAIFESMSNRPRWLAEHMGAWIFGHSIGEASV